MTCTGVSSRRENDDRMGPRPSAWFSPDRKVLAWSDRQNVRRWDLVTKQELIVPSPYRNGVRWVGFSTDGQLLRVAGEGGEYGVWDAATGRPHGALQKTGLPFLTYYVRSPDRRRMVTVTGGDIRKPKPGEGVIHVWDLAGGVDPVRLAGQVAPAMYASFTADNRCIVATGIGGRIWIYDAATGKPIRSFPGRDLEYVQAISPDGALLATRSDRGTTIRIYDLASGRPLRDLNAPWTTMSIAFSPDGRVLATGHMSHAHDQFPQPGDGMILWDTSTGKELRRIITGHGTVWGIRFSPNGRLIASCGNDMVRVWETASGQERCQFRGHRGHVRVVDFAPDGLRLASASEDGTALVWRIFGAAPRHRAETEFAALWTDLAKDAVTAHRAIAALIATDGTAKFVASRVKPAIKPSDDEVKQWLTDLGSPDFKGRETAQKKLAAVSEIIEKVLLRASTSATDTEVRRRLSAIIEDIPRPEMRPGGLHGLRAVEVLERLGTAEAQRVLARLAEGAPEARLTREAKESLNRFSRK